MNAPTAAARLMTPGDTAPWFRAPVLDGNADYAFHSAAGRPILMLFFGSAADPLIKPALNLVHQQRALFDDIHACFFGVTIDPADAKAGRIAQSLPGVRFFLDYDRKVSSAYGATDPSVEGSELRYRPHWLLLDARLRVVSTHRIDDGARAFDDLTALIDAPVAIDNWAPVLEVPRVIEPALCRRLIESYQANGGVESGFMREENGKTVVATDPDHKRRKDWTIDDADLRNALAQRISRRLQPQIQRAFQFNATRMERYIVACYDARSGGHFRAHRDNTTKGTAHRRFAVSLNLNAEDYDGGDLRFPEFGQRTYRPPTGGVVVFSCSLLHEATRVTRGDRYAFLPFLYDDAAATVREANNAFLGEGVGDYRA